MREQSERNKEREKDSEASILEQVAIQCPEDAPKNQKDGVSDLSVQDGRLWP